MTELKSEVKAEVAGVLERLGSTDQHISSMQTSIQELVERAVDRGRRVEREVRGSELREQILANISLLRTRTGSAVADELIMVCSDRFALGEVRSELDRLREEGVVEWNTPQLEQGSILHVCDDGR